MAASQMAILVNASARQQPALGRPAGPSIRPRHVPVRTRLQTSDVHPCQARRWLPLVVE